MKLRSILVLALMLVCAPAIAQETRGTSPLSIAKGGTNAATVSGAVNVLSAAPWNDASSVIASPSTFWTSSGPAVVGRFNRLLVGEAALGGTGSPPSPKDWMETLLTGTTQNGQLSVVNTIGQLGIVGGSRTSDARAALGTPSGGSQGVTGIGYNDDPGTGGPIACGVCSVGIAKSTVTTGITINQFDLNNAGPVVDITPFVPSSGGNTVAMLVTAGAFASLAPNNVSAGVEIASGATAKFRKGILVSNAGLDVSLGAGGSGVAMEMARGQSIRWQNSTPGTDAEIWGNVSGLQFSGHLAPKGNPPTISACPGFAAFSNATDTAGSANMTSGTSCTVNFATAYQNTPACMVMPRSAPSTIQVSPSTTQLVIVFGTAQTSFMWQCMGS